MEFSHLLGVVGGVVVIGCAFLSAILGTTVLQVSQFSSIFEYLLFGVHLKMLRKIDFINNSLCGSHWTAME